MDLYQTSLPAAFAAIPVLHTIAGSPVESLLESLLESLFESLLESLRDSLIGNVLESLLREPRIGRCRVFHGKLSADGKP